MRLVLDGALQVRLHVDTLGGFLGGLLQENLINYNDFVMPGVLPGQAALRSGIGPAEMRTLVFL